MKYYQDRRYTRRSFRSPLRWLGAMVLATVLFLYTSASAALACVAPENTEIVICHATGSKSNPYNKISTDVRAFLNAGHINHAEDIWSAFDYLGPKGERIDVPAQGDQSILKNGCEVPTKDDATGDFTLTGKCGLNNDDVTIVDLKYATAGDPVWKDGKVSVPFTADPGHTRDGKATWIVTKDEVNTEACVTAQYAVIIWSVNNYPTNSMWPQTLVDSVTGLDAPNLGYFDALLKGKCAKFQVDVYHYDVADGSKAKVNNLIATGHLYGSNNPPEPLISGGEGTAWKFYSNSTCITTIDVPAAPSVTDPCGPGNATWNVPANTDALSWKLDDNGHLIVTIVAANTHFKDGTTSHDYGIAPETNIEACITTIDVPAAPSVTDPCGPGNATWNVPANTDALSWKLDDNGHLIVTIVAANTHFKDGTTSHDYGIAPETNIEACTNATGDFTLAGKCGVNNDALSYTLEHATHGDPVWKDGKVTVPFTADAGYANSKGETTWTVTHKEVNTTTSCGGLAFTGFDWMPLAGAAGLSLVVGSLFVVGAHRRRKTGLEG